MSTCALSLCGCVPGGGPGGIPQAVTRAGLATPGHPILSAQPPPVIVCSLRLPHDTGSPWLSGCSCKVWPHTRLGH